MSRTAGWRPLVAVVIGVALASVVLVPGVSRRLRAHFSVFTGGVTHALDHFGPEPQTLRPVPLGPIRTAARLMPARATYYLNVGQSDPLLAYTLWGLTNLYLPDKLRVRQPYDARWVLSYRAPAVVPPGVRARRVRSLGGGVYLVEARTP